MFCIFLCHATVPSLCLTLRWVCQRKWSNAACSSWDWPWTSCTVKAWYIEMSNLKMCSCLTANVAASNWLTLAWPGAWAAVWNGWAVPSPTQRQRCVVPAVQRVSLWPQVWTSGLSASWFSVCWQAISPGRRRCRSMPFTRSFGAGRKQDVLWGHIHLSGAASQMMLCACFRGCLLLSQKSAAESRTSSALSSMSWSVSSGAEHLVEPREVRGQARERVLAVALPLPRPLQHVPPTDTLSPPPLQEHRAYARHHSSAVSCLTHCLPEKSPDSTSPQAETRTKARWWWQLPSKSACDRISGSTGD